MATELTFRKSAAKPSDYRINDGDGLYMLVRTSGSKLWRFDFKLNRKRRTLSLGEYPKVTLAEARNRAAELRTQVESDIDPSIKRRIEKHSEEDTFGRYSDHYLESLVKAGRSDKTLAKNKRYLNNWCAELRPMLVQLITPLDILRVLNRVNDSGRNSTAIQMRAVASNVFRRAILDGKITTDPTYPLRRAIAVKPVRSQSAITDERKFGGLLRVIDEYDGWITIRSALQIMALCYPRPVELRKTEWSWIDLQDRVWHIPEHLTKMRRPHEIPLSSQAVAIFERLKSVTGNQKFVFPQIRTTGRVISENAMNSALRLVGITAEEHCSHGFRSSASTLLSKLGYNERVIEASLAHVDHNEVRRAYQRYQFWDERVKMAQDWADFCDRIKQRRRNNDDIV